MSNEGVTFLGLCRLWGRESWWIEIVVGVEPDFGDTMCED